MKKFFIGCLAVIGAIAIVSVGIAIISSIPDSSENGGTTTTTQTLTETTMVAPLTTTTSPVITQPTTQTTPVVTETPTPTTPVITEPPGEGEVELIEAQNEGVIELVAYGSDNTGWIELVINSLSDDLLHVTILPGTIFESQPAGAQSSMVVLKPREILVVPREVLGPVSIETASLNMNLNVPDLGDSLVVSPDLATGNLMKLIELPDFQEEYSSIQQLAIWTLMDNPGLNEYPDAVPSAQEIDKIRSLFIEAGIPTEGYLALKPPVYVELIEAKRMGLIEVNATGTGSINRIQISLTSNSDDILEITILPGTIFTSPAAGIQSMVVVAQEMVKRVFPHQTIEPFDVAAACASMELDAPEASNSLTLSTEAPPEDLIKLLGLPDFYEEDFRVRQFAIWTITDNPERDGYMGIATGFAIFGTGPSDEEMEKIRALFIDAGIATDKYKALS
jgi:hypothetical protein